MGEVDAAPAAPAPPMPDLTALEVDPAKGERFHKAAFVHSKEGTTHRLVAKALPDGRLDLVRFACDLGADGKMNGKRGTRRIESQPVERFDEELAAIQKDITSKGQEVQGVWAHDLTSIQDVAEQAKSLEAWVLVAAKEIKPS
jgi:hypothetical protein